MLDIRVIRENAPAIQERLKLRGGDHWKLVDAVLACDEKRRKAETEKQQLQNSRKTISKQIGMLKGKGEDTAAIEAEVRGINEQIVALDAVAEDAASEQADLLLNIPNLTHDACPVGSDESANPVVREWGEKPIIADAKDADMAFGVRAPGPRSFLAQRGSQPAKFSPEVWSRDEFGYRNLPEFHLLSKCSEPIPVQRGTVAWCWFERLRTLCCPQGEP